MTIKDILTALPAKVRLYVYSTYALAVFIAGGLAVAHVETGATNDILTYVGGALGLVAASNVALPEKPRDEDGTSAVEVCLCILIVVAILIILGKL